MSEKGTCPFCFGIGTMIVQKNFMKLDIATCTNCRYTTTAEFLSGYWYAARDIIQRGKEEEVRFALKGIDKTTKGPVSPEHIKLTRGTIVPDKKEN
jgi:hypothetical protein